MLILDGYYLYGLLRQQRLRLSEWQPSDTRRWCVFGVDSRDARRKAQSYWGAAFTPLYGIRVKLKKKVLR
jgi:hypothetical protein